jgi:hypothetical protein
VSLAFSCAASAKSCFQQEFEDTVFYKFFVGLRSSGVARCLSLIYVKTVSRLHISIKEEIIVGINLECCRYYEKELSSLSNYQSRLMHRINGLA